MVTYRAKSNRYNLVVEGKRYKFSPYYATADTAEIEMLNKLVESGALEQVMLVEKKVLVYEVVQGDNVEHTDKNEKQRLNTDNPPQKEKAETASATMEAETASATESVQLIECKFGAMSRAQINALAREKGWTGGFDNSRATLNGILEFLNGLP